MPSPTALPRVIATHHVVIPESWVHLLAYDERHGMSDLEVSGAQLWLADVCAAHYGELATSTWASVEYGGVRADWSPDHALREDYAAPDYGPGRAAVVTIFARG